VMKRLWTEDNVTHKGRFFKIDNLTLGPRPVQKPHPPIFSGGTAEAALKRAGTWSDGFICGSSAVADFPSTWEKIAGYARAAGRNPDKIEKAALTFMAINDNKAKAVKTIEEYVQRYYGRLRGDLEQTSVVGSPAECAEKIDSYFERGLETVIIGAADPDPRQLDTFGEKILPLLG